MRCEMVALHAGRRGRGDRGHARPAGAQDERRGALLRLLDAVHRGEQRGARRRDRDEQRRADRLRVDDVGGELAHERAQRAEPVRRTARAPGRPSTRWSADARHVVRPEIDRWAVGDEHVVSAVGETARIGDGQPFAAAESEPWGDEENPHSSHYGRAAATSARGERNGALARADTTVRGVSAPPIPAPRTSVAASAVGIIGSTVVSLVIGYIASIVLARSLGPAGRGLVAVIQSDVVMVISIAGLGTPTAITFFASRRTRFQPALSGFALIYAAALGVLAALAVLFGGGWLAEHQGKGFDRAPVVARGSADPADVLRVLRREPAQRAPRLRHAEPAQRARARRHAGRDRRARDGPRVGRRRRPDRGLDDLDRAHRRLPPAARADRHQPATRPRRRGDAALRLARRDRSDVPLLLGPLRRARAVAARAALRRRQLRRRADRRRDRPDRPAVVRLRRHADGRRGRGASRGTRPAPRRARSRWPAWRPSR